MGPEIRTDMPQHFKRVKEFSEMDFDQLGRQLSGVVSTHVDNDSVYRLRKGRENGLQHIDDGRGGCAWETVCGRVEIA